MIKGDFEYGFLKPGIQPHWEPRERKCKDCPTVFTAYSPSAIRCAPCQAEADKRTILRASEKRKKKLQNARNHR